MPAAKRREYHHGDLKRALVRAALDIVDREGVDALTLREAAAAVGVTHTAAYRHFEDKTALLAAVAEECYRALGVDLAQISARHSGDPQKHLTSLAAAYVSFSLAHPERFRLMFGPRLNEDGRFPSLEAAISQTFAFVTQAIEEGQREGAFRDERVMDLAISMWVFAHGYIDLVLRRRVKVRSTQAALEFFERLVSPLLEGHAGSRKKPARRQKRPVGNS